MLLVFGLLLAFGALILRLQGMAFGEPSPGDRRSTASYAADRRPSRPGSHGRALSAAAAGRLVPARRGDVALGEPAHDDGRTDAKTRTLGRGDAAARGAAKRGCVGLWADGDGARMALSAAAAPKSRCCPLRLRRRRVSLGRRGASAGDPPRARDRRPLRPEGGRRARRAALARPRPLAGPPSAWARRRPAAARRALRLPRRRRRGPAPDSRSARCTPGSSNPAISASTPAARPIVRLEERLGYVHKGVDALMAGADLDARRATRRPRQRRQHGRLPDRLRPRRRSRARIVAPPRAASGCAR